MSIGLILEVMDHAPAGLTSGERAVLMVIAERANEQFRIAKQGPTWNLDTIARRSGVGRDGLRKIFQRLRKNGCEVRVQLGTDKLGQPVFAFEGTAMTFKIPVFKRGDAGTTSDLESQDAGTTTDEEEVVLQSARGGTPVPERRDGSTTQSLKTLKEPSKISLSDARTSVPAPRDSPDEDRERGGSTSSEDPNLTPQQRMVIEAGCPEHLSLPVVEYIEGKHDVKHLGWWRRVKNEGDLPALVQEGIAANTGGRAGCGNCGGTGKATGHDQYDRPIPVDCPFCTPMTEESRQAFVAQLKGQKACNDGIEGGNIPMPGTGWMACPRCRKQSGYVSAEVKNQQGRRPANPRILRNSHENQDRYDVPISAYLGGSHQAYRNPEDQGVYDDWSNR